METIFNAIRNYNGVPGAYPTHCGKYNVKHVRDLTTGYDVEGRQRSGGEKKVEKERKDMERRERKR